MAQSLDKPLAGTVLCCTSLSQDVRIKLADAAIEMGAVHKLDLTSDVTHLIVGNIATAKYRYVAKERPDIKVLKPEWVEAVRVSWVEGGDVDVAALEEEFALPTFSGLEICVTGFDELEQRNYITDTAKENGAKYHGDLTKVVTHLIAAVPEGKKYNAARSWGLTVVSFKWFQDSVERGMALAEKLYDPLLPPEEQGKDAFRRVPKHQTTTGKRAREGEAEAAQEVAKKKLRRSASTRMDSQSQDMWQDISAHSVNVDNTELDQWNDRDDRTTTLKKETAMNRRSMSEIPLAPSEAPQGIFAGIYLLLHGFGSTQNERLQQFLEPNGAQVVKSTSELEKASRKAFFRERYLLVPHAAPTTKLELPDIPHGTVLATEWWVERSVHYQHYLDPATDVLSRPLWLNQATGFENTLISATGLDGVELRQAAEAVTMMGATYQQILLPSSSVLVCGSHTVKKEKGYYAQKHRIPTVSTEWLWDCLKTGKKAPFDKYRITLPTYDPRDFGDEDLTGSPVPSDVQQQDEKHAMKRKDESLNKRLSATRKRQHTPSLSLQASNPNPPRVIRKPQPIFTEDVDDETSFDSGLLPAPSLSRPSQHISQPLQELSPNRSPPKMCPASGPGKKNNTMAKEEHLAKSQSAHPTKSTSTPQPSDNDTITNGQPPSQPRPDYAADLASILQKSRPSSGHTPQPPPPQRRKNRPLGRAPSGISNRSNSTSLNSDRFNETSSTIHAEDATDVAVDRFEAAGTRGAVLPPSTQLEYESADAEALRLQRSKRLGKGAEEEGGLKRVASVGTVKDSAAMTEAGVSGRVKGRARGK